MKRCSEYIVIPKSSIYDWSFESDRHCYCARVEGHTGNHTFYNNGKRITDGVGFICDTCGEDAVDGIKEKFYEDDIAIRMVYYCAKHYNEKKEKEDGL